MNFREYNGWSNEATWSIFTNFTRYKETRVPMKQRAQEGTKQARSFVEMLVHSWYEGTISRRHSAALQHLGQESIRTAIRYISWSYIYAALRVELLPQPPTELTGIAHELL